MKNILFLFFLLINSPLLFADCAWSNIEIFPKQHVISTKAMFIIEGYAYSQESINSLQNRKVYLVSEHDEEVELLLQKIYKGQMRLTQAIFYPSRELKPHTLYCIRIEDLSEEERHEIQWYNRVMNDRDEITWRTGQSKFVSGYNLGIQLNYEATEVYHFGCGPAAYASFDVQGIADADLWFKTEVLDMQSKKKTTYYIRSSKGKLYVGHGMCSGAFTFSADGAYRVRFTPIHDDGGFLSTSESITFESPHLHDNSPFRFY